mgnify:CR=1 FL=1
MKFTDVIAEILKANQINCVFGLQGGAVAHIFDSLEKYKITVNYIHHESAASLAATAYAKATDNIGCAVVTTGPGCTNAITGLMGAWQDSVPCLFLSGQVRSNHTSYGKPVRQVGTQEVNIIDIVKPLCKYSKIIRSVNDIEKELKKWELNRENVLAAREAKEAEKRSNKKDKSQAPEAAPEAEEAKADEPEAAPEVEEAKADEPEAASKVEDASEEESSDMTGEEE